MKYTIRYDDKDGSLWATVDGTNYMISQSSGELVGADGHRISDLYWSDIPNGSAEVVKNIFSDIAAQAATIAQLREVATAAREQNEEFNLRCEQAIARLDRIASDWLAIKDVIEYNRIMGKIEGVKLAMSYHQDFVNRHPELAAALALQEQK